MQYVEKLIRIIFWYDFKVIDVNLNVYFLSNEFRRQKVTDHQIPPFDFEETNKTTDKIV